MPYQTFFGDLNAAHTTSVHNFKQHNSQCCPLVIDKLSLFTLLASIAGGTVFLHREINNDNNGLANGRSIVGYLFTRGERYLSWFC